MPKILMLEFNEICPPLLNRWMAEGKLPHFSALYNSSQIFTSIADVSDPDCLEPWIQWYSIHTGLPYDEHRIFYLTDGPKAGHADIWRRLHDAGKTVMNCGSMNAGPLADDRAFYLPDPWCSNEPAFPAEVEIFKNVMAKLVQENTRGVALGVGEVLAFLAFFIRHGLATATIWAILKQLTSERLSRSDVKWRRVALADRLQFDLCRHYYQRLRPDFATFFVNSTAHLQHAYWRHMDPDAFSLRPSREELATYGDAVLFGYRSMDALLQRFFSLVDRDTIIILCSALSQQPFLKREARGGQHFYRLRDVSHFLQMLDIRSHATEPVMTHQYRLRFTDRVEAEKAIFAVKRIKLGSDGVFAAELSGNDVQLGCQVFGELAKDQQIHGVAGRNEPIYFFDLFYPIEAVKSARHHPEGVLWISTGEHGVHREPVSILDIGPTIYDLLDIRGVIQREGTRGTSLVSRFGGCMEPAISSVA